MSVYQLSFFSRMFYNIMIASALCRHSKVNYSYV